MNAREFEEIQDNYFDQIRDVTKATPFTVDGVVNASEYLKSPIKMLFLLKESYTSPENNGDTNLREFWRSGVRSQNGRPTAIGISKLAFATSELVQGHPVPDKLPSANLPMREHWINQLALFNCKKESNTESKKMTSRGWATMGNEMSKDGTLFRELFNVYAPDVILCANVYEYVQKYVYTELPIANQGEHAYGIVNIAGKDVPVLNLWHPTITNIHKNLLVLEKSLNSFFKNN